MKRLIYPALLGLALAGCSQAKEEVSTETVAQSPGNELITKPVPSATADTILDNLASAAPIARPPRNVIYQGTLDLAVTDFNQATTSINHLLKRHDAYLNTAHETRADGQHRQEMTIEVPPAQFVALVTALGQLGHVANKDVASADVTADILQAAKTLATKQAAAVKLQQKLARTANKEEANHLSEQAS